jgi:hypothetical protein
MRYDDERTLSHAKYKYVKKVPKPGGGYIYYYADDLKKKTGTALNTAKTKGKQALNTAKHLNDMMMEIIRLDAYSSSMDTFKLLDQQMEKLKDELLEYVDKNSTITESLFEFTRPFLCEQYGGFCKVENCAERHKKQSFFKRTKTKCIVAFKNRFSFVNKKKC